MKTTMLAIIFLTSLTIAFSSEMLFFESFYYGMPAGWTSEGPGTWSVNSSGNAFDDPPELVLSPNVGTEIRRFISPPINTADFYELQFVFYHTLFDNPMYTTSYDISIQVTDDTDVWSTIWSQTVSENIIQVPIGITIPRQYLYTTGFHIAFACTGSSNDLLGWYIDNMYLGINTRIAYGTWTAANSPYYLQCNHIIPQGYELTIEPGVEVIASYDTEIDVYGYLQAQGTPSDSIRFTTEYIFTTWRGITIHQSDQWDWTISYCIFENSRKDNDEQGGALNILTDISLQLDHCRFSNNYAGSAGAVNIFGPWQIYISYCTFNQNSSYYGVSTLAVGVYDHFSLSHSAFCNNYFEGYQDVISHVRIVALMYCSYAYLNSNSFAMNSNGNSALEVMGMPMSWCFSSMNIYNSIFWNPYVTNEVNFPDAFSGGQNANFINCDINPAKVINATPNYNDCINADPLFVSLEDCHLLGTSPCINTGYLYMDDPDGSRKDMGAFPVYNKAIIQAVDDVPFDQGRQVEVFWARSGMDNTWMPGSFYSVWRGDTFRGQAGTFINSPAELSSLEDLSNVYWLERDIAWIYLGQLPAYNFAYYAFEASTQQDSSATGTHAVPFRVVYQWSNGFSVSDQVSGYSVDNIPPDPVRDLAISKDNGNMRLDWTAVTTGTCNGTAFPELNGVFYKIFCSDDPYFDISPATYLTTTTETFSLLNYLTEDRKFFRVIVSDQ